MEILADQLVDTQLCRNNLEAFDQCVSRLLKSFPVRLQLLSAVSLRSAGRAAELLPNCLCSASASRAKWSASAFVRKNLLERLPALFLRPSTTHFEVAECSYFATRIFEGRIVSNISF